MVDFLKPDRTLGYRVEVNHRLGVLGREFETHEEAVKYLDVIMEDGINELEFPHSNDKILKEQLIIVRPSEVFGGRVKKIVNCNPMVVIPPSIGQCTIGGSY